MLQINENVKKTHYIWKYILCSLKAYLKNENPLFMQV